FRARDAGGRRAHRILSRPRAGTVTRPRRRTRITQIRARHGSRAAAAPHRARRVRARRRPGPSRHFTGPGMITELRRTLSLRDLIVIVVGTVIGSGIFLTPGAVVQRAGSGGVALIVWTLGGVLSLLGALTFAE